MEHKGASWLVFFVINAFLLIFFSFFANLEPAGDIAEYYGMTESLLNHGSIELTLDDRENLEQVLHPGYFEDPQYYVKGRAGLRYPVHFFLYSVFAVPVRLLLEASGGIPLNALAVTNVMILALTVGFFLVKMKRAPDHVLTSPDPQSPTSRKGFNILFISKPLFFIILVYLSPLVWFLAWPGPDVLYMCMLFLLAYFLVEKKRFTALFFAVVASWHSQPLIIIVLGIAAFIVAFVKLSRKTVYPLIMLGLLAFLPYIYNMYVFGVLTPWTLFNNGWTQLNGFGVQNIQLQKLYEQFFDMNIGLFWYMPVVLIMTIYIVVNLKEKKPLYFPIAVLLATALMYQTNPAWHYGTSGFGPTRHILFIVPILLYALMFFYDYFRLKTKMVFLSAFIVTQFIIISCVGLLTPDFQMTLYHTPLAQFVLNYAPALYHPTPEIFVDRTNHTDLDRPSTAIYLSDDICRKAYVLITDRSKLEEMCGEIPEKYESLFDNEYMRFANYPRAIVATDVILRPDPESCAEDGKMDGDSAVPTSKTRSEFACIRSQDELIEKTGVSQEQFQAGAEPQPPSQPPSQAEAGKTSVSVGNIIESLSTPGAWRISAGQPMKITVPAGYTAEFDSYDGVYVNY